MSSLESMIEKVNLEEIKSLEERKVKALEKISSRLWWIALWLFFSSFGLTMVLK